MHHSYIDRFAQQDSPVHRLDARAKLLVVLAYTVVLVSFRPHQLAALAPMVIAPLALLWVGMVPVGFALKRAAVLCPFVLVLAMTAPVYDRTSVDVTLGPWHWAVAGGWLTTASILAKFVMGILALTALMCTTPFSLLLEAMRRLGLPRLLVMNLAFLYRYIFVLIDEAMRVRRARDFRGAARAPVRRRLAAAGGVIGALFARTIDRSQRVHLAMLARGYDGQSRTLSRLQWNAADTVFVLAAAAYLVVCRWGLNT